MTDQLVVTQEAKIGWSELALPIKGRFIFRDHEGGARAAAFDAEKQRLRRRFLPFRHRAKYFRVRHFCKANAEPLAQGEFKNRRKSRSAVTRRKCFSRQNPPPTPKMRSDEKIALTPADSGRQTNQRLVSRMRNSAVYCGLKIPRNCIASSLSF